MKKTYILLVVILTIFIFAYSYYKFTFDSEVITQDIKISIPKGASMSKIIDIFNENGLLKPKILYLVLAKIELLNKSNKVYAGYYKFDMGMSNRAVFNSLFSGKNLYISRLTFPEGISVKEFSEIIAKNLSINANEFLRLCKRDSILKSKKIPSSSLEGYLMPNTYEFFKDIEPKELLDYLLNEQNRIWKEKFSKLAEVRGMSRHKVLTLASIIEAETPIHNERPVVSGLYQNRLKKGMRLQADPTVQYALGEKKHLSYDDLKINNAYNTYFYSGLPPGPINNPSISSIEAALNPDKNNYIYMVAKGDGSNTHNFATTLDEHQKNVRLYRNKTR